MRATLANRINAQRMAKGYADDFVDIAAEGNDQAFLGRKPRVRAAPPRRSGFGAWRNLLAKGTPLPARRQRTSGKTRRRTWSER
jgi:hypothetical protein